MQTRIATITGTYGTEVENGVGRFLAGLHRWSREHGYALEVFAAGDHLRHYPRVHNIHALSFAIPGGFSALEAYYPLEGRRQQLGRALEQFDPHIVHISTPEALGITGLGIARNKQRLVAGIYHTDFPAFARQLVQDALERLLHHQGALAERALGPVVPRLLSAYRQRAPWWERWLLRFLVRRFVRRNRRELGDLLREGAARCAHAVAGVVREALTQFYRPFHLVLARSETYRQKLIRELALDEERVRTLRSGVDTVTFSPERGPVDEGLRARLGIPATARVVLYVGRVTDEKNTGFLADAWRQYQAAHAGRPTVFVAVGSGNLEAFARRAGPGVCTPGSRHGDELSAVYRLADVFWTASVNETLGQVVLEALASGVPVLVGDQGAVGENVEDGRTGRVLAVDEPARWARELSILLADDARRVALGRAARQHAEGHTIESSYRDYWALHEELLNRHAGRNAATPRGIPGSHGYLEGLGAGLPVQGRVSVHLSDFHAGKRSRRIPKEAALRVICRRAAERGARCFLQGDFLDTRPPLQKFKSDLAMVRRTFEAFGVVPEVYLEGNHDYEFGRARQIEALLNCRVARSLVYQDAETGVVLTHGHVSELPEIWETVRGARSPEELIDALAVDRLKEALRISALRYDVVGVVTNVMENAGLEGLEDAWRHSFAVRRWLANWLMELPRRRDGFGFGVQALIHMLGSSDREQVLGQLCNALGGWALVYGHTHEPHVSKHEVVDPPSGERRTVLLGNCGSFCRKSIPPTWVEAAYPHLELWGYRAETDDGELLDRVTLSPEEVSPYRAAGQVAGTALSPR
jgi:glycosyltransferase involved in cell wall biosynthesis/UDP-2,3-diacylglucosamine pyrophosphatase LpxH